MNKQYFKLFAHCIPVTGHLRSSICDLQREEIYYIPNEIAQFLSATTPMPLCEIRSAMGNCPYDWDEYVGYLVKNELGFFTDEPECFPALPMDWLTPAYITNAIVDISEEYEVEFSRIFDQLATVGCRHLQLRFYRESSLAELDGMLALLEGTLFRSVEVIVKFSQSMNGDACEMLTNTHKRLKSIFIHSAPVTQLYKIVDKTIGYGTNMGNIIFTEQHITSNACCGVIGPLTFSVNIRTFTEAQLFNTCLNRKVGIDTNGDIKNCPSSLEVYGNIYAHDLAAVLPGNSRYESKWHMKKNDIKVCRDCEHRFVCLDCRVYTADTGDSMSKPAKCLYNPYTAQWEEGGTAELKFGYNVLEPYV